MPDHSHPLRGRRIVVTRAGEAGRRFAARLRELGAEPIICPAIAIVPPDDFAPLDAALAALDRFNWLTFTSANAVVAVLDRLPIARGGAARPSALRVGVVGPATADALAAAGWQADAIPPVHTAEALVAALGAVASSRILFPASEIARPTLAEGLRARGAHVTVVTAYRTIAAPLAVQEALLAQLRDGAIDAITFTSPSTVQGSAPLLAAIRQSHRAPAIGCVGPITAAAAREAGLTVSAVATDHSEAGLLATLLDHFNAIPIAGMEFDPLVQ